MSSMTRDKLRSLRFWLPLLLVAFASVWGMVLYLVEFRIRTAEFESAFQQTQWLRTAQLQNQVERWVQRNDPEMVQAVFADMGVVTPLNAAWFLDNSNVVVASSRRATIGFAWSATNLVATAQDESELQKALQKIRTDQTARSVMTADRNQLLIGFPTAAPLRPGELTSPPGGIVLASYDLRADKLANLRHVRQEYGFYLGGTFLMALLLGLGMHFLVTRRLELLKTGMFDFAAGTLSKPMVSKMGDEISQLFDRFNEMASVIRREIAKRTEAETALRQANNYNRSLIEASLDPLVTISPEGKITDVNATTEAATGCTRAELIGTDFSDYFTEPEKARAGYQRVFDEGAVWDYPLELRHRDGRVTSVLYNASVYRDEHGAVRGIFAAARDITERKRAEEALHFERERFRSVLDQVPASLVLLAPDYQVPFVNRFFRDRFGEARGRRCYEYLFDRSTPCDDCETFKVFKTNAPHRWEWKGPDQRDYDVYDFPFTDADGSPLVLEMGLDITERKRAEAALRRLNRELRAISDCNQILMRATDEPELLKEICRVVCEGVNYRMAWVGYAENDAAKSVRPVAWSGAVGDYLEQASIVWSDTDRGRGPTGTAIRTSKTVVVQDFKTNGSVDPWREAALRQGYRASISLPLKDEAGAAFAAFTIYSSEANAFTPEEIRLLEELGGDLAFGITVLRGRAERRRAEQEIRTLNAELERRIAERTRDLKLRTAELETIFETAPVGLSISYDAEGTHIRGNPALERLTGVAAGDELSLSAPRRPAYRVCRNGVELPTANLPMQRACRGENVADEIMEIVRPDGRVFIVQSNVTPLRDEHGQVRGAVGAFMDVTELKRFEEALRRSEERFRTIYDTAPVSIWQEDWAEVIALVEPLRTQGITDFAAWFQEHPDFVSQALRAVKILDVNQWTVDMFAARDKAELLASLGVVFATSDTLPGFIGELVALARGEAVYRTDLALNTVTGKEIYGSLAMSFPPADADTGAVLVSVIDITERKKAERSLQRQAALIDLSPDAIIVRGLDGTIHFWSRGAETLYGWTQEEACGQRTHSLFKTQFPEPLERIHEQLEKSGRWSGELVHQAKDGRIVIVQSYWLGQLDVAGRLTAIFESNMDITDRKRAEEALRRSEEQYRRLFDTTLQGVVHQDANGKIISMNPAAARILGRTPAEFIGSDSIKEGHGTIYEDGSPIPGEAHPAMTALRTGQPVINEVMGVFNPKEQAYRWINVQAVPLFRENETRPYQVYTIFDDITERRRTERDIQKLNGDLHERASQLEVSNKELEAFCYSVSHDLRAPLRAIDGFSRILLEEYNDKLDDDGRDNLQRVCAASQRMGHLIDDLLTLSRITRSEMRRCPVSLSEMATQIVAELKLAEPARAVEVRIQPGLMAEGDPILLRAVLENLLGNAWKFTAKQPAACIEFGRIVRRDGPAFFVRDNGAGFDMTYVGKLFGAFQRLHAVTDFPGTGIGLATVQRIIRRHGGRVEAEGVVDQGATFYFTLPSAAENRESGKTSAANVPTDSAATMPQKKAA